MKGKEVRWAIEVSDVTTGWFVRRQALFDSREAFANGGSGSVIVSA
jgi:hypothetical protein